ncbi:MAG: glycosyltransferase family 4 protein [Candidatus Sumerlaeia bacterium]
MMIRILHIIHGRHFGGGEKIVLDLATGLDRSRFRPGVVCLAEGRLLGRLQEAGVPAGLLPMRGRFDLTVLPPLLRLVREKNIAVLHSHTSRTNFLARLVSRRTGIPNINTVQSPILRDTNQSLATLPLNARVDRWMAGWCTMFAAVSEDSAQYLFDQGVPRRKVQVIYNGVPVPERPPDAGERLAARRALGLPEQAPLVGMVAQLRPRKGPEYLVLAAGRVRRFFPDARVVFVGDAEFVEGRDYLAELRALAERLGVADTCRWVGFQHNVAQWLKAFDVLALPSLFGEGLPLSVLEAMAHGLPVVLTDTEGNRRCVRDGREGFLVPPRDGRLLGERLVQLLQSAELRAAMGRAAHERARERFSIQAMLRAYSALYESLAAPPRRPA